MPGRDAIMLEPPPRRIEQSRRQPGAGTGTRRGPWRSADFAWLQERVDQGKFDAEFRQYVCLFHGRAQSKLGDTTKAESLWRAGIAIDPASKVADELRRALDPGRPNR